MIRSLVAFQVSFMDAFAQAACDAAMLPFLRQTVQALSTKYKGVYESVQMQVVRRQAPTREGGDLRSFGPMPSSYALPDVQGRVVGEEFASLALSASPQAQYADVVSVAQRLAERSQPARQTLPEPTDIVALVEQAAIAQARVTSFAQRLAERSGGKPTGADDIPVRSSSSVSRISSATHGDVSVAELKRRNAIEDQQQTAEVAKILERARGAS